MLVSSFIRMQSLSVKDPTQPQYPALAFSAKFKLVFGWYDIHSILISYLFFLLAWTTCLALSATPFRSRSPANQPLLWRRKAPPFLLPLRPPPPSLHAASATSGSSNAASATTSHASDSATKSSGAVQGWLDWCRFWCHRWCHHVVSDLVVNVFV